MKWYAASIIIVTKFKDGIQEKIPVLENVVLIQAESDDEAMDKAKKIGLAEEGDSSGTYTFDGRPATFLFGGVRKLVACVDAKNRPDDGTEVTYSTMEVADSKDLERLIAGKSVTVEYIE